MGIMRGILLSRRWPTLSYDLESITPEHGWRIEGISPRVQRVWSPEDDGPFALKRYADAATAEREYAVLRALRDFGVNLGPEALSVQMVEGAPYVLMSWLDAEPLTQLPSPDDDEMWHRLMAVFGAPAEMNYATYTRPVPMRGEGIQQPRDLQRQVARLLPPDDPQAATILDLLDRALAELPAEMPPVPVGLCRRAYTLDTLLWDGHHLLAIDWEAADWSDLAAELGLWSTHPAWQAVPASHWVWVRWEFARLSHADKGFVPRATLYGRLGWLYWAAQMLAAQATDPQPDRAPRMAQYIQRASKLFG